MKLASIVKKNKVKLNEASQYGEIFDSVNEKILLEN